MEIGTKTTGRQKHLLKAQEYKAKLLAQEYNQQEGIDYDETYAFVARLEAIYYLVHLLKALNCIK